MRTALADARAYWTPTLADLANVEATATHYWDSAIAPHRAWAVAALLQLAPVRSVLDLGCQCGPNLRAIQAQLPDVQLTGVDLNPHALALGRAWLPKATFVEGAIPEILATWPTGAFDVVLSTYCLAYQGPDQACTALAEALRVAAKAVVLIEPVSDEPKEVQIKDSEYVEWRHDYQQLLEVVINEPAWPGHGLHIRWEPMPAHELLTGVLILRHVRPEGGA